MKKAIQTNLAPKAVGPYSQAVKVGQTLYCSGQVAINPENNEFEGGSIQEQTHRVLKNLIEVLKSADMTTSNIVKTTIYLKDMSDFSAVNRVYESYFESPYPARVTIQAGELPLNAIVEIDAIAHQGN